LLCSQWISLDIEHRVRVAKAVEFIDGSVAPRAPSFDVKIEFHFIVRSLRGGSKTGALG
jgi:hypothetical protein